MANRFPRHIDMAGFSLIIGIVIVMTATVQPEVYWTVIWFISGLLGLHSGGRKAQILVANHA